MVEFKVVKGERLVKTNIVYFTDYVWIQSWFRKYSFGTSPALNVPFTSSSRTASSSSGMHDTFAPDRELVQVIRYSDWELCNRDLQTGNILTFNDLLGLGWRKSGIVGVQ